MILDRILGSADEFSLRNRFFNAAALCVAVAAFLNATTSYYLSSGPAYYFFALVAALAFMALYVLGRFYKQHGRLIWPFTIFCYLVVIYDWYWGGGFFGIVPQFALALTVAISVIMPGRQKAAALLLMVLVFITLFVLELRLTPDEYSHGSRIHHLQEELTSLLILAIILITLVSIVVHGYNREHDNAVRGNQRMTEANQRLRQMQFELEFNYARYVGILEQMSSGVVVFNVADGGKDFIIAEFNSAAETIEGVRREDILGKRLSEVFPGAEGLRVPEILQRVWSTGCPERHPESFYSGEHSNGWRDSYFYKLPSGEIVSIYRDITERKAMEDELRWSEERFRFLFQDSPNANFLMEDEIFVDCNPAAVKLLGVEDKQKIIGKRLWELSPGVRQGGTYSTVRVRNHLSDALDKGSNRFEWVHRRPDGAEIPVEVLMTRTTHRGKAIVHVVWNDISKRKQAENALRDREIRYRTLFESSSDAIMLLKEGAGFISVNQAVLRMFDLDGKEQIIGLNPAELSPERQPNGEYSTAEARWMMDLALRKGGHEYEWVFKRVGGEEFFANVRLTPMVIDGGQILQTSIRDITETKIIERQLRALATTDALTGANNRRRFLERSTQELSRSKRYGSPLSLLLLDIDRFKTVNDTYGHDAGDETLKSLVKVCHSNLRETDIFGRLGGEEFGALLIETDPDTAIATAERLRQALEDCQVSTRSGSISCTVSIGLTSLKPEEHDLTMEDLMKRADMALYEAKSAGRNCVKTK